MARRPPATSGSPFQVLRDLKGRPDSGPPSTNSATGKARAPSTFQGSAPPAAAPLAGDDTEALLAQAFAGAKPLAADNHAHLERAKPAPLPRPKKPEVAVESSPSPGRQWIDPDDPLALFRASVGKVTPIKDTGRADIGPRPSRQRRHAQAAADSETPPEIYIPDLPGDDPSALFRLAAGPVAPLADKNQAMLNRPLPPARPLPQPVETPPLVLPGLSDRHQEDQTSSYLRPGAPRRLLVDLRRGRWPAEAELDLHGLTRDEARHTLGIFLAQQQAAERRCLRLIHGKGLSSPGGEPLLRNLTRSWLSQHPEVLAFCEARPQDGGSGALLVLLRNPLKSTNKTG
ncbi:MAG TPA: Smr/MutS family protein [Azospira sp.]|nr:Smr/MutS family protein [Azospira sp.]